eukprot:TRINITY_DN22943_c0_g1_i1.p1 TRINITY_DN22943_c0_g1~~TRINITY_DN22943_c0_g1_i1.p1  ORF type:complete len:150 (-),score=32.28 TRINITY_DN22943_c0_g1_i1:10-459(-)
MCIRDRPKANASDKLVETTQKLYENIKSQGINNINEKPLRNKQQLQAQPKRNTRYSSSKLDDREKIEMASKVNKHPHNPLKNKRRSSMQRVNAMLEERKRKQPTQQPQATNNPNLIGGKNRICLLYTSDAADDSLRVDLGGRRIIKKKK